MNFIRYNGNIVFETQFANTLQCFFIPNLTYRILRIA